MKTHSGRIEVRPALKHIAQLRETWRACYRKACEHDGIEPDAKFVVFSDGNLIAPFVDKAAAEYFAAVREYQAGGYVGLQIREGRAQ